MTSVKELSPGNVGMPLMHFYIDVFGLCNLRCPTCAVGNWTEAFTKGVMSQALLDRILDKATRECQVGGVSLYNWAEPLLNPDLPALIRAVNGRGLRSLISSNLNILPDPEKLMRANPSWFRVSVSGFQQEIYARGHRHGKIEEVKANMRHLS